MRFGKKLALQQQKDVSGAPYFSHKPMKEAINRIVRELRLYQAKVQDLEQLNPGSGGVMRSVYNAGGSSSSTATLGCAVTALAADIEELEDRVSALDRQLFIQVDDDLSKLLHHVRVGESRISQIVAGVQGDLVTIGLLAEETKLRQLQRKMPGVPSLLGLCRQMVDFQVQCDPVGLSQRLHDVTVKFNSLAEVVNEHAQYLEINVAGFRKLLKRHEKQIPAKFRARPMPFLGFHRLVTHTSHHLLETSKQISHVIADAWQQLAFAGHAAVAEQQPDIADVKGLGPECEMVLKVQKQLKAEVNGQLSFDALTLADQPAGYLYPKPDAPSQQSQESQQISHHVQHQQPRHEQVHQHVHPQVHPIGHPQMHPQVHPQMHPQVHPQMHPQVHQQMHPQMHPQVHPQVHPQAHPQVHQRPLQQMQQQQHQQQHQQRPQDLQPPKTQQYQIFGGPGSWPGAHCLRDLFGPQSGAVSHDST